MAADADIFISFPGKDRKVATTLCSALESRGFTCWISARDILPGENFQVAIVRAIRKAKVMLLVFTANSNQSEEMSKELALASQQKLAVIPLRVEDVTPNDAFAYEFATRQWIDFFADWEYAIDQLAAQIAKITAPDPALLAASGRPAAKAAAAEAKSAKPAKPSKAPISIQPLPGIEPAPGPELAPVLDSQGESFGAEAEAASDAPRKGLSPVLMIGGAVAVIAAVTVAVFAFSGNKGKANPPAKAPVEASAPAPGAAPPAAPPSPPTPPQPGAAQAAATTPPAADAAATTPADAAPTAATPAKVKKAAPKKTHAPLRASRSDLPY